MRHPDEPLARGIWRRAGETDSPIAPRSLDAIASRRPATGIELLDRELPDGGVLIVVGRRLLGLEQITGWLRSASGGRVPLVVDLAGASWRGGIAELLQDGEAAAGEAPPRSLVLLRPDRVQAGAGCVDGLALRDALSTWLRDHAHPWLVVLVGPLSIAARHPLPGAIVVEQPGEDDADTPEADAATPVVDAVRARLPRADAAFVRDLYRLVGSPWYEPCAPPSALVGDLATATGCVSDALEDVFRRIVAAQLGGPAVDGAPHAHYGVHAAVATAMYCLLARASRDDVLRTTLRGVALERWLSLLRSVSYETLAAVTSSMHGEQLAGCNLSQAPPLEFADLRRATFDDADLYRLNLANADLRGASLRGADLARAHLKESDLRDADLSGADMSYASLELADLRGANLDGADLSRAFLDDARGLPRPWSTT